MDDDVALGQMVKDLLGERGFAVSVVARAADALERIQAGEVEILVTDLRMPEMGGMELIGHALRHDPRIVAVAMTGFGDLETAVRAVRGGAFDYLPKPFEPDALLLSIDKSVAERAQREELASLRSVVHVSRAVVAKSAQMRDVMALVERVAPTPASVLITGPSGAGKELIARAVHERSDRANGPFVAVNCAAIPAELLESELFGVKRGAFTGAGTDKPGPVPRGQRRHHLPRRDRRPAAAMQPKLLRVLQEREVRPLGGSSSSPIDVRVISATRHDLRKALSEGTFREDLFYRLAVVEVRSRRCASARTTSFRSRSAPSSAPAPARPVAHAERRRRAQAARGTTRGLATCASCENVDRARGRPRAGRHHLAREICRMALGADPPQDFLEHAVDRG